ncbi:hypothetical protein GCM10007940_01760 [Portibacter lacus]|uniref:Uncharacterized protein n=2 Tax=Portibacter lacus TaxID=1099794 RepID=A0AA37SMK5_9BACT|nr:hypothetical protein GCM10007940_01760 [Portibacter lacus]
MLDKRSLAKYFEGVFNKIGIEVEDTGERFTVIHRSDKFEMVEGISSDVDYEIKLKAQNISNMKAHGDDGVINAEESFRIMSVLFTPLTIASLQNPVLSQPFFRKLSGIENHITVYLDHPETDEYAVHTLIYINKEWIVVPGAHGHAKRVFRLRPSDAIDYQRQVFTALNDGSLKGWQSFKKWYFNWRKSVSEKR